MSTNLTFTKSNQRFSIRDLVALSLNEKHSNRFLLAKGLIMAEPELKNEKIKEQLAELIETKGISAYLKRCLASKTYLHPEGREYLNEFLLANGLRNKKIRRRIYLLLTDTVANMNRYSEYYSSLLKAYDDQIKGFQKIIKADIDRTRPNTISSEQKMTLHRILSCYAKRNPRLSYCQGMSLLCYHILCLGFEEEETFWIFSYVIERLLPIDYYIDMAIVMCDIGLTKHLLLTQFPALVSHLQQKQIDLNQFLINWFITVFTSLDNEKVS